MEPSLSEWYPTRQSQADAPAAATATFVVRFWHEATAGGERWRGSIEHVQSGESAAFLELDGVLSFLQSFGISLRDKSKQLQEEA